MNVTATVVALLVCLFIVVIGVRFLLWPRSAAAGFGVEPGDARALTAIKGVRDIASGIVVLTVWLTSGSTSLGWALLAAALIPLGDAVIVSVVGRRPGYALAVHGSTVLVMLVAGLVLVTP